MIGLLLAMAACSADPTPAPPPPEPARVEAPEPPGPAPATAPAEVPVATEPVEAAAEAPAEAEGGAAADTPQAPAAADEPATRAPAEAARIPSAATPEAAPEVADPAQDATPDDGVAEAPDVEAAPAPAAPITYTLQPSQSTLLIQVFKDPDTAAAGLSHDHVISAAGWSGTVTWSPDDLSACAVDIRVPVAKLVVDSPSLRRAVGLEGELSDGQRDDVRDNMLAKSQLWADQHPEIRFVSTGCAPDPKGVKVSGTLTIRGQGKPVTVTMKVDATPDSFSASGGLNIKASDFGFEPFTAMLGALRNLDRMKLSVSAKGTPR
ncbi:MAG: YceI family protein [Alphaproteobacteria bacterium]|nr:YceI family protein [Alphaproteobacteria bacterium]